MKFRSIARIVTISLMGLAVLVATGDGFARRVDRQAAPGL
jgi:hypothetical protein